MIIFSIIKLNSKYESWTVQIWVQADNMPRSIVFNKFVCFKCSYHLQQQMVYRYFDLNKGTNSFPTSNFYNNPNMAIQISYVYSITLTQAMNDTIYRVGLGVQSQNTFISSGDYFFYFELSTPLTKTAFPIILSTTHMNLVQLYTFNYITVVSNWAILLSILSLFNWLQLLRVLLHIRAQYPLILL